MAKVLSSLLEPYHEEQCSNLSKGLAVNFYHKMLSASSLIITKV